MDDLMAPLDLEWSDDEFDEDESLDEDDDGMDLEEDAAMLWKMDKLKGLGADELAALLDEANSIMGKKKDTTTTKAGKKTKKSVYIVHIYSAYNQHITSLPLDF